MDDHLREKKLVKEVGKVWEIPDACVLRGIFHGKTSGLKSVGVPKQKSIDFLEPARFVKEISNVNLGTNTNGNIDVL